MLRHHVGLAGKSVVAGKLTKALGAAVENVRRASLWQEEEEEDQTEAGEPHQLPNCPGPAIGFDREATNEGTENRTANCADAPDCKTISLLLWTIHVGDGSTTSRKGRRSEEAREEPESEKHSKVDRESCWDLKEDEDHCEQSQYVVSHDLMIGDLHKVPIYTHSLPTCGISLSGDQIIGPRPYPAT